MTFAGKLKSMGFASYTHYLRSPHWLAFRKRYRDAHEEFRCLACGTFSGVALHHVDYDRLGRERTCDVVPLCHAHHRAVHEWLEARGLPVTNTHRALAELIRTRGRGGRPRGRPRVD